MSFPDAFDPPVCASLHNRIIGIIAPAAREQYHNEIIRNFFVAYGEQAEALRPRLPAPVLAFLENIDIPVASEGGIQINFAPHLSLPSPWMFEQLNPGFPNGPDEDEHENFIVLYGGSMGEQGMYLDLDTHLCSWNVELMGWPLKWYPLERALRLWLRQYEVGKFQPSSYDASISRDANLRYIPSDLTINLTAYHNLLGAIQARSPGGGSTVGEPGLVDVEILDRFHIHGFMRDFLLRARRPSFPFVAPGIRIPTSAWLDDLLTRDRGSERYRRVRDDDHLVPTDDDVDVDVDDYTGEPLPLFPGPPMQSRSDAFENGGGGPSYTHGRGKYLVGATSGLYLWPEVPLSADHVVFVMPYPVNQKGYIEYGNSGWNRRQQQQHVVPDHIVTNDALYQHGQCPFGLSHSPRLFTVLNNWTEMVRSGTWAVGREGVQGGIDVFRDADTPELADDYRLGACFDRDHD